MSAHHDDAINQARALAAEQLSYYEEFIPANDTLLIRPDEDEIQKIASMLRSATSGKRVLDVCCGSGQWTASYHDAAAEITLLDASRERLQVCRDRFGSYQHITYIRADIFEWAAAGSYDTIVTTFWLSHIPQALFAGFWDTLRGCLGPQGKVYFADHRSRFYAERRKGISDPVAIRTDAAGRKYRVVKRLYEPSNLNNALSSIGWSAEVAATPHFIYGLAEPLPSGQAARRGGHGRGPFHPDAR